MNAQSPEQTTTSNPQPPLTSNDEFINLREYIDILIDSKWLILSTAAIALAIGGAYTLFSKPIYESDLLIQVEDSSPASSTAQSLLGNASSLFDVKTPATGEIEVIRSRMVIGRAVDATKLYIQAEPNYIPVVGRWIAKRSTELSNPGILGFNGIVSGSEKISVTQFNVPTELQGSKFTLTAGSSGHYTLKNSDHNIQLQGKVGNLLEANTAAGKVELFVSTLSALPNADFFVYRNSRSRTIDDLQTSLQITEKGRQSGIISVSLQDTDTEKLTKILNEIGQQYVRQNIDRKAAEAEKTLSFLDIQLPQFKKQLEDSESSYNQFRNQQGTIALDEEAKLALAQSVELQTKLFEAEQEKRALQEKFTANHPTLQTLNSQISAWQTQINTLNGRIRGMPRVQQDSLRFQRDIQVNTELYQSLLNNAMQLRLVKEGKTGNVRLLDDAINPFEPIRPKKGMVLALALTIGLLIGIAIAFLKNMLSHGVRSAQEIEAQTGLSVYSTIPLSSTQKTIAQLVASKSPGVHLLAHTHSADPAVESLRSLRTALQFAMLEAKNNRILITGATPGIGKSFVSSNFAAILAAGGKRVLLIDADMRKGYINQFFGLKREGGLSDLIIGSVTLEQGVRKNVLPGLDLITTGTFPPNPAELLMSEAFGRVIESASSQYDMVIIDTAPVLVAADTAAAAKYAGIVMLVARAEITYNGELIESVKRLTRSGTSVTGVLFNGVDTSRRYAGAYGYKYGGYKYASYEYAPQNKS